MKIILTGGTGFIGGKLASQLNSQNHEIIILTRGSRVSMGRDAGKITYEEWDGMTAGPWSHHIEGAGAVINLAGELIAGKRWSASQKAAILNSRVRATRAIVEAIGKAKDKPKVFVSASAVGYYGNVEEGDVTESFPKGSDFLSDVCEAWEKEACVAEGYGVRVVRPRFGVVIGRGGGALSKMLLPFRLFIGGPISTGRQWFPWIHRDDVIGAIVFALSKTNISGPMNLAAPEPATMNQFCKILGEVMHRPSWAPVPGFVLKVALGEMAGMLLTGQRIVPKKLLGAGYAFRYGSLKPALEEILRS